MQKELVTVAATQRKEGNRWETREQEREREWEAIEKEESGVKANLELSHGDGNDFGVKYGSRQVAGAAT